MWSSPTDYLRKQMPYDEISGEKEGSYLLAVGSSENMKFSTVISSGPIFKKLFGEQKTVNFSLTGYYGNSYEVKWTNPQTKLCTDVFSTSQLYNTNTPFEDPMQWAVDRYYGVRFTSELRNQGREGDPLCSGLFCSS